MNSGIYQIINNINGKCYIGSAVFEASYLNRILRTAITNCACGLTKSAGGYIWRYDK